MSLNPAEKKLAEAEALNKMGRYKEAVAVLKEAVNLATQVEDKMFASGLVASITLHNILGEEPAPGTPEYSEVRKYLKIALDSYDKAVPQAQEAFERSNNVEGLRGVLELMETNQPLSEPEPEAKKKGCFIATATFESPYSPEVVTLRNFRDEVLTNYVFGRWFIRSYYCFSPILARFVSSSEFLKSISKSILSNLVSVISNRKESRHE